MEAKLKYANYEAVIKTVETHTLGEYTRVVIDGFPEPEGKTMIEKKQFLEKNCDHYRQALIYEPKGHHDMFGSVIVKPVHEEADYGVIFFDNEGYLNMCGHGTIGTATAMIEAGLIPATEPITHVIMDAPAGLVDIDVEVKEGKAVSVTFRNVPAFMYKPGLEIDVDGLTVKYDITFGGSFFALIDATQFGKRITVDEVPFYSELGYKIREKINESVQVEHPTLDIHQVDVVEFYAPTDSEGCDMQNIVIFGDRMVDRSPCGTGTCAKLAALDYYGELKQSEPFYYESVIGSRFTGMIVGRSQVGDLDAIIPQVTGAAYLNGTSTFVIDGDDPLKYGFKLY